MYLQIKSRIRPIYLIIVFLILTIIIISCLVLYLRNESAPQPQLKGFNELNSKLISLSSDPDISNDGQYGRMLNRFQQIEKLSTTNEQYDAFLQSTALLNGLYSFTNNPKLYPIKLEFRKFAEQNFPQYKKDDFSSYCQDPACADEPQSDEILKIVNDLNSSDIDKFHKEALVRDITNVGYLSKNEAKAKALTYLYIAYDIDNIPEASISAYKNTSNNLKKFVEKKYPNEYKEITSGLVSQE